MERDGPRTQRNLRFPNDLWADATKRGIDRGCSTTEVILEATSARLEGRTLTLSRRSADIVQRAGGAEYLDRVILAHTEAWRASQQDLERDGWSRDEIRAACDARNWLFGRATDIAARLREATRTSGLVETHGLDACHWKARIRAVDKDPHLAAALILVIEEWWRENAECERLVEGM